MTTKILLSLFSIITLSIIISAFRNKISSRIGFRNVFRRLGNTILVVIGSMVGTALITGSLVMQDSMYATSRQIVDENVGEQDLILYTEDKELTGEGFTTIGEKDLEMIKNALDDENIDGILPYYEFEISPTKVDEQGEPILQTYMSQLVALDEAELANFGDNPVKLNLTSEIEGPIEKSIKFDELPIDIPTNLLSENELAELQAQMPKEIRYQSEAIVSKSLADDLDLKEGDLVQTGIHGITFDLKVKEILDENGIVGFKSIVVNNELITQAFNLESNSANLISVSAKGGIVPDGIESKEYKGDEFQELIDEKLEPLEFEKFNVNSREMKENELSGDGLDIMMDAFLFLSMFGAFAGVLLIVNLYSMLAGERKAEMGIMRAIALTRGQLVRTFVYEGFIYSLMASFVGVIVGLGVGYLFTTVFNNIFGSLSSAIGMGGIFTFEFAYKISSLAIGGVTGFIITIITVFIASYTVSKINIVNAIRNLKEIKIYKLTLGKILKLILLFGIILASIGTILFASSLPSNLDKKHDADTGKFAEMTDADFEQYKELATGYPLFIGINLLIWITALFITNLLRYWKNKDISRHAYSTAAILTVIFNTFIDKFSYIGKAIEHTLGAPIFFLNGLLLVVASTILISYNLDVIVNLLSKIFKRMGRLNSIFRIALRYPGEKPSRTGLTMTTFAIIIYLVISISCLKASIGEQTDSMKQMAMGDYSVRIMPQPLATESEIVQIEEKVEAIDEVDNVSRLQLVPIKFPDYKKPIEDETESDGPGHRGPMTVEADDDGLLSTELMILPTDMYESLDDVEFSEKLDKYEDGEEIWEALISDSDKIVLGSSYAANYIGEDYKNEADENVSKIKVGDKIKIADRFNGEVIEKEVIAIVDKDTDNPYLSALLAGEAFIDNGFNKDYVSRFGNIQLMVKENKNVDISELTKDIKKETSGLSIMMIMDVESLLGSLFNFINSIFLLFQGFLSLSLIIGSSGLAIIITRAIQERRQQIGMLRALGFQRSMILQSFFIESTFIALLSIIIGVSMGLISVGNSFEILMKDSGMEIVYPIGEISFIIISVYIMSLLFSLLPSLKAAKLEPVEATNYPE